MGNFGLNWNDRQLARETQAGTAAAGMAGEAQTLQQQALNALQGGAMGATAQSQQSIQDFLSYLGQATGQNQVNVNAYKAMADAANQAQSNKQQASQAGKSWLTGGLGTAGSLLGGLLA
jgi:flagellar biosynthesis chaperone FliJ